MATLSARKLISGVLGATLSAAVLLPTRAEVIVTGQPGLRTGAIQINYADGNPSIDPNTQSGNLFHSFDVFNIFSAAGESVTFNPPPANSGIQINNVISRVTGGVSPFTGQRFSVIDGPLNSAINGANFFFINPHGVLFGNNADINVSGSFHVGTADTINFTDGGVYFADGSTTPLSHAPVSSFGFLSGNPGPIQVQSPSLHIVEVDPGKTLSLVGGTVNVGRPDGTAPGFLLAPDGRVDLVSITKGEATFDGTGFDASPSSELGPVSLFAGNIGGITRGSIVDGKEVQIRAGELTIDNSFVWPGLLSILLPARMLPTPDGGEVNIKVSGDATLTGTTQTWGAVSGIRTRAGSTSATSGAQDVADITVDVGGTLSLSGLTTIRTQRFTDGNDATVLISADKLIVSNGANISVNNFYADTGGTPGSLTVNANQIEIDGAGNPGFTGLTTQSNFHPIYPAVSFDPNLTFANGGNLTMNVTGDLTVKGGGEITADSFGFGNSGNVNISASNLFLSRDGSDKGSILAQSLFAGDSGTIDIRASGNVVLNSGFRISTASAGTGQGGSTQISANSIQVFGPDSGIFSATLPPPEEQLDSFAALFSALGPPIVRFTSSDPADCAGGACLTTVLGLPLDATFFDALAVLNGLGLTAVPPPLIQGDAGQINLSATSNIVVSGSGALVSTSAAGDGNGGSTNLTAQQVIIENGGAVVSQSIGTGDAGDVNIVTSDSVLLDDGRIATRATIADGGNITISTVNLLDMLDSEITTSVESGIGGGGNIDIDPQAVVLQNSSIIANAFGGPGGNIRIVAGQFIVDQNSIVSASSALGIDGQIEINAPDTNITGKLVPLPKNFLDASKLLRDRCGARGGAASSFSAKGRGGVPPGPDGYLPSYAMGNTGEQAGPTGSVRDSFEFAEAESTAGPIMASVDCGWQASAAGLATTQQ